MLLTIHTRELEVGIDASRVLRVVLGCDWDGPAAMVLEALLAGTRQSGECRRILVLSGPLGQCALGTDGELGMRECQRSEIAPLPALLWSRGTHPVLTAVAMPPDEPPLPLLSVDVLGSLLALDDSCRREGDLP